MDAGHPPPFFPPYPWGKKERAIFLTKEKRTKRKHTHQDSCAPMLEVCGQHGRERIDPPLVIRPPVKRQGC